VQQSIESIDISRLPGPQQQICGNGFAAVGPGWVRQTDGHPTVIHRPGSAYYAGSATNFSRDALKYAIREAVNKKLSYRRVTARCVLSVVILPITKQQYRNYLYDKSLPNRWYEVGGLVGGNVS